MFKLQLCLDDEGHAVFCPSFDQISVMAQAVLDGAVRTTFDMPRIGSQISVSASSGPIQGKSAANSIPTMDLDDIELAQACPGKS